jgi:mannose-6-phosphate isomerase-like protein (cupin superfamily)
VSADTADLPTSLPAGCRRPDPATEILTAEDCHILESWNLPDDPGLSIARARVEPGVTTRWHRLRGIAERYLIISGQGVAEVEGMPPTAVAPGDLVYIPPDRVQRIRNAGPDDLVFYALCTPRFVPEAYLDAQPGPRDRPAGSSG